VTGPGYGWSSDCASVSGQARVTIDNRYSAGVDRLCVVPSWVRRYVSRRLHSPVFLPQSPGDNEGGDHAEPSSDARPPPVHRHRLGTDSPLRPSSPVSCGGIRGQREGLAVWRQGCHTQGRHAWTRRTIAMGAGAAGDLVRPPTRRPMCTVHGRDVDLDRSTHRSQGAGLRAPVSGRWMDTRLIRMQMTLRRGTRRRWAHGDLRCLSEDEPRGVRGW